VGSFSNYNDLLPRLCNLLSQFRLINLQCRINWWVYVASR